MDLFSIMIEFFEGLVIELFKEFKVFNDIKVFKLLILILLK